MPNSRLLEHRFQRLWKFVLARLSPDSYLGLHLTIGLAFSLGALAFFGSIVEDIAHRETMAHLDGLVYYWLHAHMTPVGTEVFIAVSLVGAPVTVAGLGAMVAVFLWVT